MEQMKKVKLEIDPNCTICFEVITQPCQLACQHVFCVPCLQLSLKYQRQCPICRIEPPTDFKCEIN